MRSKPNKKKLMIAISAGIIASFMVLSTIGGLNRQIQQQNDAISNLKQQANNAADNFSQQNQKQDVVVAKANIPAGTQFSAENIEIRSLEVKNIPPDTIRSTDAIMGMTSNGDIAPDSPVTTSKIAEFNKKVLNIPAGMRAITIPMENIQGFASYITVGSKIDIVSATKSENLPEMILQNVKIIAFESNMKSSTVQENPSPNATSGMTILVPANAVPRLVGAMAAGKLQLVTRNEGDNQFIAAPKPKAKSSGSSGHSYTSSVNPGRLSIPPLPVTPGPSFSPPSTGLGGLPAPATPPRKPQKPPKKVELIQANVKTDVTFDN